MQRSVDRGRVGLITLNEDVAELEELARSAGYLVVFEIIQRRDRPEPSTFIGKGKLKDLVDFLKETGVDGVLINGDLKPSQHYNLENALKVECVDRIRLVLNIFTTHASSKESVLQVERARLKYEVPLLKEWIHSAKAGEHPGFLGGGEYAVDVYYDLVKKRMVKIDAELDQISSSSEMRRKQRRKKGAHLVSLAGYTNAGKSSLLNVLTDANAFVDSTLFSTLATTTRRLKGTEKEILVTDTIGFFHDLPPFVIESFKSTIEEIYLADLVLLVVDASEKEEEIERKLHASTNVLRPDVKAERIILVMNKTDMISEEKSVDWNRFGASMDYSEMVWASTTTGAGVDELLRTIMERFSYPNKASLSLPSTNQAESLVSYLYDLGEVERIERDVRIELAVSLRDRDLQKTIDSVERIGGTYRLIGNEPAKTKQQRPLGPPAGAV